MNNKTLAKILSALQPCDDCEELTAALLKLAVSSSVKQVSQASGKQKNYLKFTKKEIEDMSEPIKILLIYNDRMITYRFHNGVYQSRYRRDGYNVEVAPSDLTVLRRSFSTQFPAKSRKKRKIPVSPSCATSCNNGSKKKKST